MNFCCQFVSTAVLLLSLEQARIKVMASQVIQGFAGSIIEAAPHPPEPFWAVGENRPLCGGTDCTEILDAAESATNGVYVIKPEKAHKPFEVFCEKRSDGGWTVIQRRNGKGLDGKEVNFRRFWVEYQRGFGHVGYEHWLGLDNIHALTHQKGKTCQLRVDMINCKGESGYAFYDAFNIGNNSKLYCISLGNYVGNAGDAFRGEGHSGNQDGCYFSTADEDNDDCTVCINGDQAFRSCAGDLYGSGWWYSNCGMADLNGDWHPKTQCEGWLSGVYWATWDYIHSLIFSELKLKCILL